MVALILTVQNAILHAAKMFPYKIHVMQPLDEEDFALRISNRETLLETIENNDHSFIQNLIFSDESTFWLDAAVNLCY